MSERRPVYAVDWDGTCVEDAWPGMGAWITGAKSMLRWMSHRGHVLIHTCRVAPANPHRPGDMIPWRDPMDVVYAIQEVRDMLDEAGLYKVEIWTKPWKPSADYYVDNKAVRFDGDWLATGRDIRRREDTCLAMS